MDKVNVAIIGLGFGAEFIPIYQRHPNAELWAICQRNEDHLNEIGDQFGVEPLRRAANEDGARRDFRGRSFRYIHGRGGSAGRAGPQGQMEPVSVKPLRGSHA